LQTALQPSDQVVLNSAGTPKLLTLSLLRELFSAGANISISSSGTISAEVSAGSASGQTAAYSITSLAPVTSIAATDLVAISQAGATGFRPLLAKAFAPVPGDAGSNATV
jgi:hypothetical protein